MSRRSILNGYVSTNSGKSDYTYDEYFGLIPPESKTFEFPLYITVPLESEDNVGLHYVKNNDGIVKQLWNYCWENSEIDSDLFVTTYKFNIGDVYINGIKATLVGESQMGSNFYIYVSGEKLNECGISQDGELIYITIYKI